LACHIEVNYLFRFCFNAVWNSYQLTKIQSGR
jgi:hypothetical protein